MAERHAEIKYTHGHQCDTMNLLKDEERAQDQSSAMVRTASSFFNGESGAAVLLSGGGVSPSPAKTSEGKLVDEKKGA